MSTTNASRKNESIIDAFEAMDMDESQTNSTQISETMRKSMQLKQEMTRTEQENERKKREHVEKME